MILANHGIVSSSGGVLDADALAFITAASITDNTQKTAVNTLVTDLKTYNLWSKMKAIYPFVGGSAASHKFNLKDPRDLDAAFRLQFYGGWTHSSTGALPNGTTAYADTLFVPNSHLSVNSAHLSKYNRTNDLVGNKVDGVFDSFNTSALQINYPVATAIIGNFATAITYSQTDTRGLFTISRTSSTSVKTYKNLTQQGATNTTLNSVLPAKKVYLAARNDDNVDPYFYNTYETAFFSLGDGLSDTETTNMYTAVQLFNTTLNRNV
jgi:hypothetical protein